MMSPMSGAEPALNLVLWNKISNLKNSHNCFSYAMNTIDQVLMKKCNDTPDCDDEASDDYDDDDDDDATMLVCKF